MQRAFACVWLAAFAISCGPNPPAPVKVMALVPNTTGTYAPNLVELKTVSDMTTLKGQYTQFVGGTRVVLDQQNDPLQSNIADLNNEQRYEVMVKDKGASVRAHYIDRSGVLWPADFHSWNLVTTFYNFERSIEYFVGLYGQKDSSELRGAKVLYWSDVRIESATPTTDNALFMSLLQSYVIVPFESLQLIPLAMNIGVIGHEVAHQVFNKKVLGGAGLHPALSWEYPTAFNLLKSMDEGLADFHGYSVTRLEQAGARPKFLAVSVSDPETVAARDVSRNSACLNAPTRTAYQTFTSSQWVRSDDMYEVGNILAVSLYFAGNKENALADIQKGLLAAYDDDDPTNPGLRQLVEKNLNTPDKFTMESVADVIVGHLPLGSNVQREVCTQIATRWQLKCQSFPCDLMPHCPDTATRINDDTFCPLLAPF